MARHAARHRFSSAKNISLWLTVLIGAAALAIALYTRFVHVVPQGPLRIGTWNLQWFGQEQNRPPPCDRPRTAEEIRGIAAYIHEIGFQLLAVEEIAGDQPMHRLNQYLADASGQPWTSYVSNDGYMLQLGFLWNKDRVHLADVGVIHLPRFVTWRDVPDLPDPYESLHIFPRLPIKALVTDKLTGMDFLLIAVHLKSQVSNPESPPPSLVQREEVRALRRWIEEYVAVPGNDRDVILVGDFNFGPQNELFAELLRGSLFLSALPDKPKPTWKSHWTIDHIFVSPDALPEWGGSPLTVHDEKYLLDKDLFLCGFSDHMPVSLDLAGHPDD